MRRPAPANFLANENSATKQSGVSSGDIATLLSYLNHRGAELPSQAPSVQPTQNDRAEAIPNVTPSFDWASRIA
jgi:hypothetical protein